MKDGLAYSRHAAALYARDTVMYARRGECALARHHLRDAHEALDHAGAATRVRSQVRFAAQVVRAKCGRKG